MKRKNGKNCLRANASLILLAIVVFLIAVPSTVKAKSLYVIADIKGASVDRTQPVQAYDIGKDGTLTFQAEHDIPHRMLGAVGMAIDTDNEFLFITYEASEEIQLVDARTMMDEGTTEAPDARDLAGIVYDHSKKLLYCVDRRDNKLYVYDWDPESKTLTHAPGSPFTLRRATAYGIALNEIDGLLYVGNGTNKVTVYSTSDWKLVDTITLDRIAISVAVGVVRGFLYTGGGFAGNMYLTQYHLATGTVKEVQVEPDAGVMGLGVDTDTGYVYVTTGMNNEPGGDNLLVFDTELNQIDIIPSIGNPTGLVVPGKDIGYNPLNLRKTLIRGGSSIDSDETPSVGAGSTITYGIHFDNYSNIFSVRDVVVTDRLPDEVTFVTADDDGVTGHYDPKSHTYEWMFPSLPMGNSVTLELTAEVNKDVELGTTITNFVTINSNQTAPTTARFDVVAESNALNLTKKISGVAEGETVWVDADESMTYKICFDNRGNDFPVTNVSVVDYLPNEVQFVSLGGNTPSGKYDATQHTYTWSFSSLEPGETVCLDLNVRVNKDVDPGVTITNSVMIDSSETPPSMASAEALTYNNPINLSKSIVGVDKGEMPLVSENEIITYEIYFDNMDGDSPVHNVTLIDVLPPEVSFVKAVDDRESGQYDAQTHTYTWLYGTLSAKVGTFLELVVRVNEDVPPETTITNYVTLDSDETRPRTASAEAMTKYKPLNIRKEVLGDVIGQTLYADPGDTVTYSICFDNDNENAVTNVSVIDELPKEVVFVSATGNKDYGNYDGESHTYTWSYKSLPAGSTTCVTLVVRIKEDVPRDTIIFNTVKISSDQTDESHNPPDDNEINTGEEPSLAQEFSILPEIIRDTGGNYEIQATAILPAGIGKDDIEDIPPILYLPKPLSGKINATRQIVYGSDTRAKIIALFDKTELVNAIDGYGHFTLTVVGKLKKGQSWYGQDTVCITGYTGR
jgi:uncharacterized repeat protein (TIGR01451 family)/fimbrial isopeptide formation D2 family protein